MVYPRHLIPFVAIGVVLGAIAPAAAAESAAGYAELVTLFEEWREFQRPVFHDGVPDYAAAAMAKQHRELAGYMERLEAIDPLEWPISQQVDYELVRAEMNGLDFDHRVLRPWARDPSYYMTVVPWESDTPLKEGPVMAGTIELWRLEFPLSGEELADFGAAVRAVPAILEQARVNLVDNARDLWRLGIPVQRRQQSVMDDLAARMAELHPEVVADLAAAARAAGAFADWLEETLPGKTGPSGIGIENYDWYLRHVHLVPYSWEDELRLMERELARTVAHMALEEHRNRELDPLETPPDAAAWEASAGAAIEDFLSFLDEAKVFEVEDYMEPALRERVAGYVSEEDGRHFFNEVDLRDPRVMRCHHMHWIDKARMRLDPHPSPIRSVPSLYNIWDSRSEGLATAMEEMMSSAGLLDDSPRSRELVYIMVAQRAARAIAGLRVQSNEWSVEKAVRFAAEKTPRGWFRADGDLVLFEQLLYLRQPGYGTSYLTGKSLIESLMAEVSLDQGEAFELKAFMDRFLAIGMAPVSLIRWEMTGREDEVRELTR
jgi:hypothetical protein